jgi:hypothetical protein
MLPLPPPPVGRPPRISMDGQAEDKQDTTSMQVPSTDDKIQALRAYNRARGLCYTCSERWAHGHNYGPTVQLDVVEELLGLLDCERETYSS